VRPCKPAGGGLNPKTRMGGGLRPSLSIRQHLRFSSVSGFCRLVNTPADFRPSLFPEKRVIAKTFDLKDFCPLLFLAAGSIKPSSAAAEFPNLTLLTLNTQSVSTLYTLCVPRVYHY